MLSIASLKVDISTGCPDFAPLKISAKDFPTCAAMSGFI